MTDSYRAIRTNVVLAWTLSNGALVAVLLSTAASSNISTDGSNVKVNEYMVRFFSFGSHIWLLNSFDIFL